jgi:hypothetical protein
MERGGFPVRMRLPLDVKYEADLLQANRWPRSIQSSKGTTEKVERLRWNRVPPLIQNRGSTTTLSKEARLFGEKIFDVSSDRLSLYCFQILRVKKVQSGTCRGGEELSDPMQLSLEHPVVSYDVDFDEGVLAVLTEKLDGFTINIYKLSPSSFELIQSGPVEAENIHDFKEVQINGSRILISLDNILQVFEWKKQGEQDRESALHRVWIRISTGTRLGGWYVRASLLSPQVVACTVLSTYRTIGSMRVRHGVIELYRLDQYVPRVADILLPEAFVDALQPRILQAACKYVFVDVGGRRALQDCLERGHDGPVIIQTFSETVSLRRGNFAFGKQDSDSILYNGNFLLPILCPLTQRVGRLTTLRDILYPRAALALYSFDPTKPSYPVLGNEWLSSNFPIIRGSSPLRSSLHGQKMISCARQGRNELIFWGPASDQDELFSSQSQQSLHAKRLEDIRPFLVDFGAKEEDRFHIDDVILDGPRVLFTSFHCVSEHNGTTYATEPLGSFWGTLESLSYSTIP